MLRTALGRPTALAAAPRLGARAAAPAATATALVGRGASIAPPAPPAAPRLGRTFCHTPPRFRKGRTKPKVYKDLYIEVTALEAGRARIGDVLQRFMVLRPGEFEFPHSFVVACADDNPLPLSLLDAVPEGTTGLYFHTLETHTAARDIYWRSAAFLAAACLTEADPRIRIVGPPALLADGSGGDGFAVSWLPASWSTPSIAASQDSSADATPLELSAALARSQPPAKALSKKALAELVLDMKKAAHANWRFVYHTLPREEAARKLSGNPFKLEELALVPGDEVRMVQLGNYWDLSPPPGQPLLPETWVMKKALHLFDCSTATWKPQLPTAPVSMYTPASQCLLRVRGISFPRFWQLENYIEDAAKAAEEADHREVGREQRLFMTHPASPGTPFLLPHGTRVARRVERVVRDLYAVWRYDEVVTPQLMRRTLWETSGHWDNYRADMFGVRGFADNDAPAAAVSAEVAEERGGCCAAHDEAPAQGAAGDAEFGLKPMNCPGHCLIFAEENRSFRDLPLRFAEFSPLHRNESSGSLSGLTRVRRFHQDDAHVFCRPDQVSAEITSMLTMLAAAYRTFGFASFELVLSTRPAKFIGDVAVWDAAEKDLRGALEATGVQWGINEGDGAFYGPKIDVRLVDVQGRKHQTATIQLDFQLPERFNLEYTESNGKRARPVMIHRAILGSVERFMAILIESCRGHWPFWLSPRQVVVMPAQPFSDEQQAHAARIRDYLALGPEAASYMPLVNKGSADLLATSTSDAPRPARPAHVFHVDLDSSQDRLAKRVLLATQARYNFIVIAGLEEIRDGTVRLRARESYAAASGWACAGRPPIEADMGSWKLEDLRELMIKLDSHHW